MNAKTTLDVNFGPRERRLDDVRALWPTHAMNTHILSLAAVMLAATAADHVNIDAQSAFRTYCSSFCGSLQAALSNPAGNRAI